MGKAQVQRKKKKNCDDRAMLRFAPYLFQPPFPIPSGRKLAGGPLHCIELAIVTRPDLVHFAVRSSAE